MAEDAGLIPSIGEWALRTACRRARAWLDTGYAPLRMAVNVSAYQINAANLVDTVRSALEESKLDPALLELEVTENALQTGEHAFETLNRLKALGVRLALDDFGTGYSTLSSLKLLPFDRLKIDRAFVRDVQHDANGRGLARAIIAMGRSLSLEIIAEGVETQAQLEFLREEGCDEMQGYLIGVPMSAEEMGMELRAQATDILSRVHSLGVHERKKS
jgi:EAL domain-containing protein (putative c-di-GMP-specific phosphodiesterase class I)